MKKFLRVDIVACFPHIKKYAADDLKSITKSSRKQKLQILIESKFHLQDRCRETRASLLINMYMDLN